MEQWAIPLTPALRGLLLELAVNLLGVAALFALVIGLLLLLRPHWVERVRRQLDRRVSLRPLGRPIERPIPSERFIYRHHLAFGLAITLGSGYALYSLWHHADRAIPQLIALSGSRASYHRWLLESAEWFLLGGNLLALVVGVTVTLRPSRLKGVERWANHWISSRKPLRPVDIDHMGVDRWLLRHPRTTGGVVAIGALYILINLWYYFRFGL